MCNLKRTWKQRWFPRSGRPVYTDTEGEKDGQTAEHTAKHLLTVCTYLEWNSVASLRKRRPGWVSTMSWMRGTRSSGTRWPRPAPATTTRYSGCPGWWRPWPWLLAPRPTPETTTRCPRCPGWWRPAPQAPGDLDLLLQQQQGIVDVLEEGDQVLWHQVTSTYSCNNNNNNNKVF